jgi:hypothetical protein
MKNKRMAKHQLELNDDEHKCRTSSKPARGTPVLVAVLIIAIEIWLRTCGSSSVLVRRPSGGMGAQFIQKNEHPCQTKIEAFNEEPLRLAWPGQREIKREFSGIGFETAKHHTCLPLRNCTQDRS